MAECSDYYPPATDGPFSPAENVRLRPQVFIGLQPNQAKNLPGVIWESNNPSLKNYTAIRTRLEEFQKLIHFE